MNLDQRSEKLICEVFKVAPEEITDVTAMSAGMTNSSYRFKIKGEEYIIRIPGRGTRQLVNRTAEKNAYKALKGQDFCDEVLYISRRTGYKITRFIENTRTCDPYNEVDVRACMDVLKRFHSLKLKTNYSFDLFSVIDKYEGLRRRPSIYADYEETKKNVQRIKEILDGMNTERILAHMDSVPNNFLIDENEKVTLIDWEYASMQDPDVDVAMFCLSAQYDREHIDKAIDIYYDGNYTSEQQHKIYAYIAIGGLLWSNWCEYKLKLGIQFGDYAQTQYNYAKEYSKIVLEELDG